MKIESKSKSLLNEISEYNVYFEVSNLKNGEKGESYELEGTLRVVNDESEVLPEYTLEITENHSDIELTDEELEELKELIYKAEAN